jgi:hypothetical protein
MCERESEREKERERKRERWAPALQKTPLVSTQPADHIHKSVLVMRVLGGRVLTIISQALSWESLV